MKKLFVTALAVAFTSPALACDITQLGYSSRLVKAAVDLFIADQVGDSASDLRKVRRQGNDVYIETTSEQGACVVHWYKVSMDTTCIASATSIQTVAPLKCE